MHSVVKCLGIVVGRQNQNWRKIAVVDLLLRAKQPPVKIDKKLLKAYKLDALHKNTIKDYTVVAANWAKVSQTDSLTH